MTSTLNARCATVTATGQRQERSSQAWVISTGEQDAGQAGPRMVPPRIAPIPIQRPESPPATGGKDLRLDGCPAPPPASATGPARPPMFPEPSANDQIDHFTGDQNQHRRQGHLSRQQVVAASHRPTPSAAGQINPAEADHHPRPAPATTSNECDAGVPERDLQTGTRCQSSTPTGSPRPARHRARPARPTTPAHADKVGGQPPASAKNSGSRGQDENGGWPSPRRRPSATRNEAARLSARTAASSTARQMAASGESEGRRHPGRPAPATSKGLALGAGQVKSLGRSRNQTRPPS